MKAEEELRMRCLEAAERVDCTTRRGPTYYEAGREGEQFKKHLLWVLNATEDLLSYVKKGKIPKRLL